MSKKKTKTEKIGSNLFVWFAFETRSCLISEVGTKFVDFLKLVEWEVGGRSEDELSGTGEIDREKSESVSG